MQSGLRFLHDLFARWRQRLAARSSEEPGFFLSRWLFLRLLGVVYLFAFASLWDQIDGLIGSRGILPARRFLSAAQEAMGDECYWRFPTLCWLFRGDAFLHILCVGGLSLACLVILGIATGPALFLLWAFYLSLVVVGQVFLGYQWDALLLECGLLAVLYAPWGLRPRAGAPPSPVVRWLLRWLLFRLMFGSGMAKLLSGDPTWRGLTALEYHYQTQPLPTPISWYMSQLPEWFQQLSVLVTFAVELAVPVLLFGPRLCRHLACLAIIGFQLLIAATGNYGFFNLLTILLCLAQLDDAAFPGFMRRRLLETPPNPSVAATWRSRVLVVLAAGIFLLSLGPFLSNLRLMRFFPSWLVQVYRAAGSFQSVNSYGLFAFMTTRRPEIVIEGSDDGVTWRAYEFRWKPGDVDRLPAFTGPHMPRLDWQMWFAALGGFQENPWFLAFLSRLLEGSTDVLALLERNPFPDRPPRLVRAMLYDYRFTDWEEGARTGAWWRRELIGPYGPVLGRERG
jgi:hypothetical protein